MTPLRMTNDGAQRAAMTRLRLMTNKRNALTPSSSWRKAPSSQRAARGHQRSRSFVIGSAMQ